MRKSNVYYTIEKQNDVYVLWKNIETNNGDCGSFGCYNICEGKLKTCRMYANENNIKVKGGKNRPFKKLFDRRSI